MSTSSSQRPNTAVSKLVDKIAGAMPSLDADGRRIALALYKSLAGGGPTTIAALSRGLGLDEETVRDRLGSWPGVYYDAKGVFGVTSAVTT